MYRKYLLTLLLILTLLAIPGMVIASDITDAVYVGIIGITDNGTANTTVTTNLTLSSPELMDAYDIDTDFSEVAIRDQDGNDVSFMPGYLTNPWMIYTPSINDNTVLYYPLYVGDSSLNATKQMFVDSLTIVDDPSMEPTDNYSMKWNDIMLTASTDNIAYKTGAYTLTHGGGNVTYAVTGGGTLTAAVAAGEHDIEVRNIDSEYYHQTSDNSTTIEFSAGGFITTTMAGQKFTTFNAARIYEVGIILSKDGAPTGTANVTVRNADTDALIGTIGSIDISTIAADATLYTFTSTPVNITSTTNIRVLFECPPGDPFTNNIDIHKSATDLDTGVCTRYKVGVGWEDFATNDASMMIKVLNSYYYVDSVLKESDFGYSLPDTGNNWICDLDTVPYLGEFIVEVDGVDKCSIDWNYGAIFTDDSGNGNDATPVFRTAGTDLDITAALLTWDPVNTAIPPAYAVTDPQSFYSDNITMSGQFTTGNVSTTGGPPGFALISDLANAGEVPNIWVFGMIALCLSIGGHLFWIWMQRRFSFRSLWPFFFTGAAIFGLFIALGGTVKVFDFWMMVFYVVIFICIMVMSRHTEVGGNVSTHGMIGFAAQSWIGLTLINKMLESTFVGASETAWVNTFAFTQHFKLFNIFSIPVLNLDFWTKGIPSLFRWDYSFFGGNAQMFQYLLYSLTAVVAFIVFGMVIGMIYNFFTGR